MMAKEKLFKESGNWYKGNIHAHTTNSDGSWTPERSVKEYRKRGYSFICFTEHDYYTDLRKELNRKDFIVLPGVEGTVVLADTSRTDMDVDELTGGKGYVDLPRSEVEWLFWDHWGLKRVKTHHIHGILGNARMQAAAGNRCFSGSEYTPVRVYFDKWDGAKAAQAQSAYYQSRGCFTTYNHPIWSRVEPQEVLGAEGFWAIEVYNYATVNECGEGEDTTFWDGMLARGNKIRAFASDDNHNHGYYRESFGGYIMVQAEELTHESIVNSMLEGYYYSSSGPEIHQWGVREGRIYVECSPVSQVNFICGGPVGSSKGVTASGAEGMTAAECKLNGDETYIRVEVIDDKGKKAWTNPVFF